MADSTVSEHQDKVALITGGARGQGRSHAQLLASKGCHIALLDVCKDVDGVPYPMATPQQLAETKELVEAEGVRCVTFTGDVRDLSAVQAAADSTVESFGQIDYLLSNVGVASLAQVAECTPEIWDANLSINLTGTFNSFRAVLPHMLSRGTGNIVATSSVAGRGGFPNGNSYCASKWGVIGLVKTAAAEVAGSGIRVNSVCPSNVATDMFLNDMIYGVFRPDLESPGFDDIKDIAKFMHPQQVPYLDPIDVSNAVLFLLSSESRYITGEVMHLTAGQTASNTV